MQLEQATSVKMNSIRRVMRGLAVFHPFLRIPVRGSALAADTSFSVRSFDVVKLRLGLCFAFVLVQMV